VVLVSEHLLVGVGVRALRRALEERLARIVVHLPARVLAPGAEVRTPLERVGLALGVRERLLVPRQAGIKRLVPLADAVPVVSRAREQCAGVGGEEAGRALALRVHVRRHDAFERLDAPTVLAEPDAPALLHL
jgi:hypothetical protein